MAVSPLLVRGTIGVVGVAAILALAPSVGRAFVALATHAWTPGADLALVSTEAFATLRAPLVTIAIVVLVAAALAGGAQTFGLFSVSAAAPGASRARSREGALLGLGALAVVACVALVAVRSELAGRPREVLFLDGAGAITGGCDALARVALCTSLGLCLVGAADLALRRMAWQKRLWMSRAELEKERRGDEGDPRVRAEQRRRHRDLGRGLAADLASAHVVVAGSGAAAALRVDGDRLVITCAGERLIAARIIDLARRHGLAVRSDEVLAVELAALGAGAIVPAALMGRATTLIAAALR